MAVVLWIFIALKNRLPSAGFEPANFGSSGRRDNQYTNKNDLELLSLLDLLSQIMQWSYITECTGNYIACTEVLLLLVTSLGQ
jgi:hypothetical protein